MLVLLTSEASHLDTISRFLSFAIDHRTLKKGLPVRSAVLKQCAVRLVVGWVTTSESLMLIVFTSLFLVRRNLLAAAALWIEFYPGFGTFEWQRVFHLL
jgi:hypothetical protein